MKISKLIALWGVLGLVTTGCTSEEETAASGGETETETESGDDDSDGDGATSTDGGDTTTTGADGDGGSSEDDAGFITAGDSDSGEPPPPAPNGGQCSADEDCESEKCFIAGGGFGVCSECKEDAECQDEEGVGSCGLDLSVQYAVCQDGSLGSSCQETASCEPGLFCSTVIDTGGFLPLDFCSECDTNEDCTEEGDICSPFLDQEGSFTGYKHCVQPGEHENGQLCPLDAEGAGVNEVCDSEACGVAELNMGVMITVGVCGECLDDMGCVDEMLGDTCNPPTLDTNGVSGATCSGGM